MQEYDISIERTAQQLITVKAETLENANKALENGDLGLYQDLIEQGQNLVQQATELLENN